MLRLPLSLHTFKGGEHPNDNKAHTKDIKIKEIAAPKIMVFPVLQHAGAPAEAVVSEGDTVKMGQLIAKKNGFISANIHSSVSGIVTGVEPRLHPCGSLVKSIIIENDDKYEICDDISPLGKRHNITKEEIIKAVSNAGIVGMGGAAFPTHVKLMPPEGKKINYVIINGSECEP